MDREVEVRIEIEEALKNKGWKLTCVDKNVLTDRTNPAGPDYILKTPHRETPIIIIQAKRKGKDLNEALEQAKQYAHELQAPIAYASDGSTLKTIHLSNLKPLMLNGEELDEFISEPLALQYLHTNEHNTIGKKVIQSRQELMHVFSSANKELRKAGLQAGSERFSEFCNLLFLKIFSEAVELAEESGNKLHAWVPKEFRWDYFKNKDGNELLSYVNNRVLRYFQQAYGEDIFLPLQLENPVVLKRIINHLDPLLLADTNSDIKGDAFEYFLKAHSANQNKDLGEYFTPRHIVKTLVRLVNPKFGETVYDPFCGTGGMLIESFKHIYHKMPLSERNLAILQKDTIFGGEITKNARIAKMNMILTGNGHHNITRQDSLKNPSKKKVDVVITNIPFSLGNFEQYAALYKLGSPNGDSLCIEHCFDAVSRKSSNPRMGLIIPEGILFDRKFKKLREYIYQNSYVQDIISLPSGAFKPYTDVKTSMLYLTQVNQKKQSQKSIWHFTVKNDGYTLNTRRERKEGENDLDKFLSYNGTENEGKLLEMGFNKLDMERIKNNNYVSLPNPYKKFEINSIFESLPLGQLVEEITLRNTINAPVWSLTSRAGGTFIPQEEVFKERVASEDTAHYKLVPPGYFAYNPIGMHASPIALNGSTQVGCVSPRYVVFKVKNEHQLKPRYLYWLWQSEKLKEQSKFYALGNVRQGLGFNEFCQMTIPVPSIEVQESIVSELDKYRGVIQHARDVIENYHPHLMIDAQWETKSMAEVCTINPSKNKTDLAQEQISMSSMDEIPSQEKALKEVIKGHSHWGENDLLIAKTSPSFGIGKEKMSIVRSLKNGIGFSPNELIVVRAHPDQVKIEWVYYCLRNLDFFLKAASIMTGSVRRQRISVDFVKSYQIPIPPLHIQEQIVDKLEIERKMIDLQKDIVKLFESKMKDQLTSLWQKSEIEQEID